MTRQDMNGMILNAVGQEVQDKSNVAERIGATFTSWFQRLVAPPPAPPVPPVPPAPPAPPAPPKE